MSALWQNVSVVAMARFSRLVKISYIIYFSELIKRCHMTKGFSGSLKIIIIVLTILVHKISHIRYLCVDKKKPWLLYEFLSFIFASCEVNLQASPKAYNY